MKKENNEKELIRKDFLYHGGFENELDAIEAWLRDTSHFTKSMDLFFMSPTPYGMGYARGYERGFERGVKWVTMDYYKKHKKEHKKWKK